MLIKDSKVTRLKVIAVVTAAVVASLLVLQNAPQTEANPGFLLETASPAVTAGFFLNLGVVLFGVSAFLLMKMAGVFRVRDNDDKSSTATTDMVLRSLVPNTHLAFYQRQLIVRPVTGTPAARRAADQDSDLGVVKNWLKEIDATGLDPNVWKPAATQIRKHIEGKELALIQVISSHGDEIIHGLGRKIESGDRSGAQSILEGSLLKKLCFILHPDKWESQHANAVFIALKRWVESAKDILEQYCIRTETRAAHDRLHKQMMQEMKEYFARNNSDCVRKEEVSEQPVVNDGIVFFVA